MAYQELDTVKLRVPLPQAGLAVGAIGTVLLVHGEPPQAYEVEISGDDGVTLFMGALTAEQIEPV